MQSAYRPEIEFKFACDVIESVNFAEFLGFYDVTGNFELDFWAGWLYLGAALDFSSSFFLALSDGYLDRNWSSIPFWILHFLHCKLRFFFPPLLFNPPSLSRMERDIDNLSVPNESFAKSDAAYLTPRNKQH